MFKYHWRKSSSAIYADEEKLIRAKVAFKTQETHWVGTAAPVIALISIHSAFHDGFNGDLKMRSFMSTIKDHVKGPITVLLADRAHIHAASIKYENDLKKSVKESQRDASQLIKRYQTCFDDCKVAFWHSYIQQDKAFDAACSRVKELYDSDLAFQKQVQEDAKKSRQQETPDNQNTRIERAIADILEQCVCVLVLASKGYRFQFYPGRSYASTEYVNQVLISQEKRIDWIHVFLSIEKKTILHLSSSITASFAL